MQSPNIRPLTARNMKLGQLDSLTASQADADAIMLSLRANATILIDLFAWYNLLVLEIDPVSMDGAEDKDVSSRNNLGSPSRVTVTEPVASGSEKAPAAEPCAGEVEGNREEESQSVKTSSEKVVLEVSSGSCNGVDKEVGVSGSDVRHSDDGETLQKKVVLVFDGREVDLERAAEDSVDDIPVAGNQDPTVQPSGVAEGSSNKVQREECGGKDGGVSCSDGKGEDDKASPDGGADNNPNTGIGISGGTFSSVDKRPMDGNVAQEGQTQVTDGSNDGETYVQDSADASNDGETCVQGSVDGDTQLMDDPVDEDAQVNDPSSYGETQVIQDSLTQDFHVIEARYRETQVPDGTKVRETRVAHVSVNGDNQLVGVSRDGDSQLNNFSQDAGTQAIQSSADEVVQVVEDPSNKGMDGSRDVDVQVNEVNSSGETQAINGSLNVDTEIVEDTCTQDMDGSRDGESRVIQGSVDENTQFIEDPDAQEMDDYGDVETEVPNDSGGGETQVVPGSVDEDTQVLDGETQVADVSLDGKTQVLKGSVEGEEHVKVVDMTDFSKDEDMDGGLTKQNTAVPIEDLNSQEAGPSENDIKDLDMRSGLDDTSRDENRSFAVTEKAELAEESEGQPMRIVEIEEVPTQDSETLESALVLDEVFDTGNEAAIGLESTVLEDLGQKIEVLDEALVFNVSAGGLTSPLEASGSDPIEKSSTSDALEGMPSSSANDTVQMVKNEIGNVTSETLDEAGQYPVEGEMASVDDEETTCPIVENVTSETLDEGGQDPVEGKMASVDDEEISCSNIEGMDADAFNENFCFSVEELQASGEMVNGSTEHHYHAIADPPSFSQPTDVYIGGEATNPLENKVLLSSGKEQLIYHSISFDHFWAHSNVESVLKNRQHSTDAEQTRLQKQQGITLADQLVFKAETGNDSVANGSSHQSPDSASSFRSTQAVAGDDVAQMDPFVNLDATLYPAGDNQNLNTEAAGVGLERYNEAASIQCDVLPSNVDLSEASENLALTVEETMMEVLEKDSHEEQTEGVAKAGGEEVSTSNRRNTLSSNAEVGQSPDSDQLLNIKAGSTIVQEVMVETHVLDTDQFCQQEFEENEVDITDEKSSEWASLHNGSLGSAHQACYQLPFDHEGEFHVSDLVWGKVKSHPWWPGQIFDPSDASDQALKYQKKDSFLVAYFGDRTFAWNEAPLLKHFRSHFSQGEKQSNSESFQNAVGCALEEFSRRVELGLACSCVPEEDADRIRFQLFDNSGIQLEACRRGDFLGKSGSADLFEPVKLVNYVKSLAQCPAGGANQLDLVILKSQLLSFYRLKGYSPLPEFQFCGDLLEDADSSVHFSGEGYDNHAGSVSKDDSQTLEISQAPRPYYYKRKYNLKDGICSGKKEKWDSIEEEVGATDGKMVSPSSAKIRKGPNHFKDESAPSEGVKTISLAKISNTTPNSVSKPSFKIGECIRRAASQMTGSPSMLKSNSQKFDGSSDVYDSPLLQQSDDTENYRMASPMDTHSTLDELLLQLQSAARNPLQRLGCLDVFVGFFSDFRNSVVVDQHDQPGKRRKVLHSVGDTEAFEFVDMNDTYWTDRVIQNGSEEQPPPTTRKSRKRENLFVPVSLDNKPTHRSNVRNKRYISDGNDHNNVPPDKKPIGYVDEKAPAELVMHFPVVDSVPSEMKLNKMFKSFGPLKESETEVDRDTNRARVVFKHCSDAQTAYGSASKFNIFGSLLVNYQLNYTISVPFKSEPLSITLGEEDATVFFQF
ncbi:unnamed protein product [Linum tenue]|uniref:PWWP domain-containing protein n=1 Tax=Linum tenue TaxID=586396 RepID=A0AAV0M7Z1_9ROSI|nr:unnamed protein product [Linum tenue]